MYLSENLEIYCKLNNRVYFSFKSEQSKWTGEQYAAKFTECHGFKSPVGHIGTVRYFDHQLQTWDPSLGSFNF